MIVNTFLPPDLHLRPLLEQEKILSSMYENINKASQEIFEKLGVVRGKIGAGGK